MRVVRLVALSMVAMAFVSNTGRAQDLEEVPEPSFTSGRFGWFEVSARVPEVVEYPTACQKLGKGAFASRAIVGGKAGFRCWLDGEIDDASRQRVEREIFKDAQKPPSAQLGERAIWQRNLSKVGSNCPPGMKLERVNEEFGCVAYVAKGAFCARGTPEGSGLEAGCGAVGCEAGETNLALVSNGQLAGCVFCPVGSLDLKETLALNRRRGEFPPSALCKGPAKPKPSDLRRRTP